MNAPNHQNPVGMEYFVPTGLLNKGVQLIFYQYFVPTALY